MTYLQKAAITWISLSFWFPRTSFIRGGTNTLERKTFFETVYSTNFFHISNQNVWNMWVLFGILVVLYNLYWQIHCVPDSIHFSRHKQNSSNCVVNCGTIAGIEPHVVDGQFLKMASSVSKTKELENWLCGNPSFKSERRSTKSKSEEAKVRRIGNSKFSTGVRSEVERQKSSDDDFELSWRGNKNEANKI